MLVENNKYDRWRFAWIANDKQEMNSTFEAVRSPWFWSIFYQRFARVRAGSLLILDYISRSLGSSSTCVVLEKGKGKRDKQGALAAVIPSWFYEHSTRSKQAPLSRCRAMKLNCRTYVRTSVCLTLSITIVVYYVLYICRGLVSFLVVALPPRIMLQNARNDVCSSQNLLFQFSPILSWGGGS